MLSPGFEASALWGPEWSPDPTPSCWHSALHPKSGYQLPPDSPEPPGSGFRSCGRILWRVGGLLLFLLNPGFELDLAQWTGDLWCAADGGSSCWCEDQLRGVSLHPSFPAAGLSSPHVPRCMDWVTGSAASHLRGKKNRVTIWFSLFLNMPLKIRILDSEIRRDLNSSFATLNIISLNNCFFFNTYHERDLFSFIMS